MRFQKRPSKTFKHYWRTLGGGYTIGILDNPWTVILISQDELAPPRLQKDVIDQHYLDSEEDALCLVRIMRLCLEEVPDSLEYNDRAVESYMSYMLKIVGPIGGATDAISE